mgnify:CR=1 FL=1
MKQVHKYISLLLVVGIMSAQLYANISREDAIKVLYANIADTASVEIFMCDTIVPKGYPMYNMMGNFICSPQEDSWFFFVDESPLANWAHTATCYCIDIDNGRLEKATTQMPPKGYEEMHLVKAFYILDEETAVSSMETDLLQIYATQNATQNATATIWDNSENNYAMIISGGINKKMNYKRYWNDCSFIYKTLIQKYKYKKSNITVLMADGTDPAADMYVSPGIYKSSPLDLDGDGVADIQYAATYSDVINVLKKYLTTLQKGDNLFIYTIDHGGLTSDGHSTLCLWTDENSNGRKNLYDYELGNYIKQYSAKGVNVNIVMGQCHSGGFIDYVNYPNVTIATACKKEEVSYALNLHYDAFVYYWTSAMNQADHKGKNVSSDYIVDGYISMFEAYLYAKTHDTEKETPQRAYSSYDLSSMDNATLYGIFPSILGADTLCEEETYTLQNIPKGSQIAWYYSYEGENNKRVDRSLLRGYGDYAILYRVPHSTRIQKESTRVPFDSVHIPVRLYVGLQTIGTTITRNGAHYDVGKNVVSPDTIKPGIKPVSNALWFVNQYRTFIDTVFQDEPDDVIEWTATYKGKVVAQQVGHEFRVKGDSGTMEISATYVPLCYTYNTARQSYTPFFRRRRLDFTNQTGIPQIKITKDAEENDVNGFNTYVSLEGNTHYFDTDHTLCFYGKDDGIIKYTFTSSEALVDIPFDELSEGLYVVKLFVNSIENDSKQVYISKNGLLWGL